MTFRNNERIESNEFLAAFVRIANCCNTEQMSQLFSHRITTSKQINSFNCSLFIHLCVLFADVLSMDLTKLGFLSYFTFHSPINFAATVQVMLCISPKNVAAAGLSQWKTHFAVLKMYYSNSINVWPND